MLNGELDDNKARTLTGIYSQTAKRENMLIQIAQSAEKYGGKDRMWKRLNCMNLINDKVAIDVDSSPEKVKCPAQGWTVIGRDNCLDFSGLACNVDYCQNCEQFAITRKQFPPIESFQ